MATPPRRPIHKLLVANRGEIAVRIINAAREYDSPINVYALATPNDTAHTLALPSKQVLHLPNASDHLKIPLLISLAKKHHIDAVHPGYGFLSESREFAERMWKEANAIVIGPGPAILASTGDKLAARRLAVECDVPVLPAVTEPTSRVEDVRAFVAEVGLPVMIKAVDGGGGRGIRLVKDATQLDDLVTRAAAESPSRQIFVEKAAVDGYRHVEVQIVGDGTGAVAHLWERDCSIQRRYQKVVEVAPSPIRRLEGGDEFVTRIIEAAIRMARSVEYLSLGTFEFLANQYQKDYFFLEVNPRLQVEHTITEQVSSVDLVDLQLHIAHGGLLADYESPAIRRNLSEPSAVTAMTSPVVYSIQCRLTAEDPSHAYSLSIGKVHDFVLPSGNGLRIDTSLLPGCENSVSADFDSLLAKIIVTACSWSKVVHKAHRALEDTRVEGTKTNVDVLRAIISNHDFARGQCDTQWLEQHSDALVASGQSLFKILSERPLLEPRQTTTSAGPPSMFSSSLLLRKGDRWEVNLSSQPASSTQTSEKSKYLLKMDRVLRNEFPSLLAADIELSTAEQTNSRRYRMAMKATSTSALMASDPSVRKGDPTNREHVTTPFSGKLVEVLVDEGDEIKPGQVICVIKQMKMELEVRAGEHQRGVVKWVTDLEDGTDVAESVLIAELDINGLGTDHATAKL